MTTKVNFDDLKKFKDNIEKLSEIELQVFIESCAKELAARLLAKVIKRTPVGQYPNSSGKKGGTLRRGWTAGKQQSGVSYAKSLPVHYFGGTYVIEVSNPVNYASYVEFGHRTRNHRGWVSGRFMLTISEQEIDSTASRILEKKIEKKLKEVFK